MRRIRLNRHDNAKERDQQITMTAGELRARLDQVYEEGKVASQKNLAETMQHIIEARREERLMREAAERQVRTMQIRSQRAVRDYNKEKNRLTDKIRELELAGPLAMLNNKVNRNANRKTTDQKKGACRGGNRRHTRAR